MMVNYKYHSKFDNGKEVNQQECYASKNNRPKCKHNGKEGEGMRCIHCHIVSCHLYDDNNDNDDVYRTRRKIIDEE